LSGQRDLGENTAASRRIVAGIKPSIRGPRREDTSHDPPPEVEAALARAGLDIPEREKPEIAAAAHYIAEMAARVRGDREMGAEPAHIFPDPGT
jgi:hypothetical protein